MLFTNVSKCDETTMDWWQTADVNVFASFGLLSVTFAPKSPQTFPGHRSLAYSNLYK